MYVRTSRELFLRSLRVTPRMPAPPNLVHSRVFHWLLRAPVPQFVCTFWWHCVASNCVELKVPQELENWLKILQNTRKPKLLPCSHSVCLFCIKQIADLSPEVLSSFHRQIQQRNYMFSRPTHLPYDVLYVVKSARSHLEVSLPSLPPFLSINFWMWCRNRGRMWFRRVLRIRQTNCCTARRVM